MKNSAEIIPHSGLTLLEAYRAAKAAGMYLVADDRGEVRISPLILPGWREVPLKVKITAPDSGRVCTHERAAA